MQVKEIVSIFSEEKKINFFFSDATKRGYFIGCTVTRSERTVLTGRSNNSALSYAVSAPRYDPYAMRSVNADTRNGVSEGSSNGGAFSCSLVEATYSVISPTFGKVSEFTLLERIHTDIDLNEGRPTGGYPFLTVVEYHAWNDRVNAMPAIEAIDTSSNPKEAELLSSFAFDRVDSEDNAIYISGEKVHRTYQHGGIKDKPQCDGVGFTDFNKYGAGSTFFVPKGIKVENTPHPFD